MDYITLEWKTRRFGRIYIYIYMVSLKLQTIDIPTLLRNKIRIKMLSSCVFSVIKNLFRFYSVLLVITAVSQSVRV